MESQDQRSGKRRRLLDAARTTGTSGSSQQDDTGSLQHATEQGDEALPTDVEAAILFFRNLVMQSSSAQPSLVPLLVLKTQLCSVIKDRTLLEASLDDMRRRNVLRLFRLPSLGVDEHGLMLTQDYTAWVQHVAAEEARKQATAAAAMAEGSASSSTPGSNAASKAHSSQQPGSTLAERAASAWCSCVVPHHTEVSISHSRLVHLLAPIANQAQGHQQRTLASAPGTAGYTPRGQQQQPHSSGRPGGVHGTVPSAAAAANMEAQVSMLLQLSIVSRHPSDDAAYMLCVPALGPTVKSIIGGRKELLALISRKPNSEMSERALLGSAAAGGKKPNTQPHPGEGGFLRNPFQPDVLAALVHQQPQQPVAQLADLSNAPAGPIRRVGGVKLRQSNFDVQYHLHDMVGKGSLQRVLMPTGYIVRVPPAGADARIAATASRPRRGR